MRALCYIIIIVYFKNDLVGPVGYGAARFISNNTEMTYKIQFENDANASAPAQRVFIEMKLDRKLDSRTFRLRGFGFGSYQKEMNARQSVIQVITKIV